MNNKVKKILNNYYLYFFILQNIHTQVERIEKEESLSISNKDHQNLDEHTSDCCCNICSSKSKQKEKKRKSRNRRKKDTGVKPCFCKYCDRDFAEMPQLRAHEAAHRAKIPYRCRFCSFSFKEKLKYEKHVKKSHSKVDHFSWIWAAIIIVTIPYLNRLKAKNKL